MLVRITHANGLFSELYDQWSEMCQAFGEDIEFFYKPHFDHAKKITLEPTPDPKYGVYALTSDEGKFECLMHCNVAEIKGFDGPCLRVLWLLLSPTYVLIESSDQNRARLFANIMKGILHLSENEMQAANVKVYLQNHIDRMGMAIMSEGYKNSNLFQSVKLGGAWLELTKMPQFSELSVKMPA